MKKINGKEKTLPSHHVWLLNSSFQECCDKLLDCVCPKLVGKMLLFNAIYTSIYAMGMKVDIPYFYHLYNRLDQISYFLIFRTHSLKEILCGSPPTTITNKITSWKCRHSRWKVRREINSHLLPLLPYRHSNYTLELDKSYCIRQLSVTASNPVNLEISLFTYLATIWKQLTGNFELVMPEYTKQDWVQECIQWHK